MPTLRRLFLNPMSTIRTILQPLAIALLLAVAVRASRVGIYSIPSASMQPTLQAGDTIVVTPYAKSEQPRHGDVVVFRMGGQTVVKRVIAAEGDLVEARDGRVLLRGHTLAEPYVDEHATTGSFNGLIVPSQSFFVLGDNRVNSLDSRQWGVVPRDAIVGRARVILWSSHLAPEAHASARSESAPIRNAQRLRIFRVIH